MSKKSIITLSIIGFIIALIGILFGAVFRLRSQKVTVPKLQIVEVSKKDIISAAGLKNGQSIFMIDKQKAIDNVEKKFPNIKVIEINTTSLTEINIRVRTRYEMFYAEFENKYFIMDEDLKVLNILEKNLESGPSNEPEHLINIESDLNIDEKTKICDFVGSKQQKKILYQLHKAVTNNVKKIQDGKKKYYTRDDMKDLLKEVELKEFDTFNKIIITTKYGVKLDIENPQEDMADKINICFSTIRVFISEGKDREQSGTIKIYYDLDNTQKSVYIPQS